MDNQWNELEPEERYRKRLEQLKPALDAFFVWIEMESQLALPKSKYGQAIEYARNQEKVMRVLEDGRLELDNSLAERTVKPFVIGRKNWIFANAAEVQTLVVSYTKCGRKCKTKRSYPF